MKSIGEAKIEQRRRPQQAFISTLQRASLLSVLTLFTALPLHANSGYTGASVGSNGTVYGWGVSDATTYSMFHMAYVSTALYSPKGRYNGYGMHSAQNSVREDVSLAFDPTDLGTYLVQSTNEGYCYSCSCWLFNCPTGASVNNNAQLSCGAAVTRGQSATCTVSNYGGVTISNWKFTDGQSNQVTVTASSGTTANTWSGPVVQSGTVSTTVSYLPQPITASLTVNARTGWAFTAAAAQYMNSGPGTGACASVIPQRPSEPGDDDYEGLGESCLDQGRSDWTPTVVSGGPNNGYKYAPSALTNTTAYQWVRTAGLNSGANFYTHQTGVPGCISGAQLATNVQRHESGSGYLTGNWGHWGNYNHSQGLTSNNVGSVIEASLGPPSQTSPQFKNSVNASLDNAQGTIQADTASHEPWGPEFDSTHTYNGEINWYPYNYCP
jgi:hypothetical protein